MAGKYILFAGRQVPIHIEADVFLHEVPGNCSFYKPTDVLSPTDILQLQMIRPTMQNYSYRYNNDIKARFTADYGAFGSVGREELDALGQTIRQIALHHDVTLSAEKTFHVLCSRGLSTHFTINYDGSLYQFMDCYHTAWATGDNNNTSVAIDMNNPVLVDTKNAPMKDQRGVFQGKINGGLKTMLGYTDAQYETLVALIKALTEPVPMPPGEEPWVPLPVVQKNCFPPLNQQGEVINRLLRDSVGYNGFLGHYHCSANKWDPGPAFDWLRVLNGLKGERNSLPLFLDDDETNIGSVGGKALADLFERYFNKAEFATGGWYPIGANQTWHSGIHLEAPEETPIFNMVKGKIVVVRSCKRVGLGDPSFVLVQHSKMMKNPDPDNPKPVTKYWYTLYMHLAQLTADNIDQIGWVKTLFNLREDDEIPSQDIYDFGIDSQGDRHMKAPKVIDATQVTKNPEEIKKAFFSGEILLTNIDISAGETIGTIGKFGIKPARPEELDNILHLECFSSENLFAFEGSAQNEAWTIIEGDPTNNSLVRVNKILIPILMSQTESLSASEDEITATSGILKAEEIRNFFTGNNDEKRSFRKMICYHQSEWSPKTNWTKTAVSAVGWQWETEKAFVKWLQQWVPFQWMNKYVTGHLSLPQNGSIYTYHPIYLLQQLNLTYSGELPKTYVEEASDADLRKQSEALRKNAAELQALNQKVKDGTPLTPEEKARQTELYQTMDDQFGEKIGDVDAKTVYEYTPSTQMQAWEPGEWPVPKVPE